MNKIIHFSIDNCIEMFRDITINNYNSIFENKHFNLFKELHNKYNACISLYTFIEYARTEFENNDIIRNKTAHFFIVKILFF